MFISLKWLNKYIDLSDVTVEQIEEKLTASGLEVEEINDLRSKYNNIVVGYVEESSKHPDADKLSVCKVSDGENIFDVVCGAPNVAKGQKVAFAKVGAIIPNGNFEIKKAKIRGAISEGMLCAEDELGISDNHEGILVLDENLEVGKSFADAYGMNDVIFDIAITPNRADALSHIGVARDLAALFGKQVIKPKVEINAISKNIKEVVSIEIENKNDCPRYSAKVVQNVTIKESPDWLKEKLTSIGLRPINNVVDVTNFVLHEIGQPLHAFDLDLLDQNKIIVKNANEGDTFVTLDSKQHKLNSNNLMICDASKAVAVAGVMGGENSEVTDKTKNILIESAYFNPSSIRKTAKQLGISTDASYRFERGTNPDATIWAAERTAQLIAELAGGDILEGSIDVYPNEIEEKLINVRFERINKILGYKVEKNVVKSIFEKLELKIISENEDSLDVHIPLFRPDIEREIDLIEEVARIYGFDKIPEIVRINVTLDNKTDQTSLKENLRENFVGLGFNEIITNSLLNKNTAELFGNPVPLLNPQSSEMTHPRPSLIAGMLQTISRNLKVKENNLRLFEIGHIFKLKNETIKSFEDFEEIDSLLLGISGNKSETEWYSKETIFDNYDLVGIAKALFIKLFPDKKIKMDFITEPFSVYEYGFKLVVNKKEIGFGGKLKTELLKYFDIKQDVFLFETQIESLTFKETDKKFQPLLKFPKMQRDMAFIVDKNITANEVEKVIKKGSPSLLKNIKLFDIFEGDAIGKNKKSLAFQLEYFSENKTLTEEEVDKEFWNSIEKVKSDLKAELRGN